MTRARWNQIQQELEVAIALEPIERFAYLDNLGATDPGLREELDSLLAQASATGFLKTSSGCSLSEENIGPDLMIGRRLGPYEIVEQIGAGGMGEVYRAIRADDQYKKQVAIKLVRAGQRSALILSRFRNERQILASLDHPNIARLLDGGMGPEATPYLVMDLIEGQPIDEFCDNRHLNITSRLKLFLEVCSAVGYAHRRLIVHRDLKPGNILVTADGVPKLLDFGIAKILDSDAVVGVEATATVLRILTPGYASPEQIKGETITTLSDVYSLGVVLYELLTGHHPYRLPSRTPDAISRAVCEFEPERPSAVVLRTDATMEHQKPSLTPATVSAVREGSPEKLRKRLSGDLDNIVLMALRKEPERRYASVEQLGEDLRRHLDDLPVVARKDTVGYRTSKFIVRHMAAVVAAVLVTLTLLTALGITIREARIAQQRFEDVRSLANSLIFDIHDAIRDLPGSTPARKMLIERAIKYLDGLSKESGNDPVLIRDMAAAYERVGEVQGHFLMSSLGDAAQSLASYQKAFALRQRLAIDHPRETKNRLALAVTHRLLANQLWATGNFLGAREHIDEAVAIARELPQDMETLTEESAEYHLQSQIQDNGELGSLADPSSANESARNEERIVSAMLQLAPGNAEVQHSYEQSLVRLGERLEGVGDWHGAIDRYQKALALGGRLSESNPSVENRRLVASVYNHLSFAQDQLADHGASLRSASEALGIYLDLSGSDPRNAMIMRGVAFSRMNVAAQLAIRGDYRAGLASIDQSIETMQAVVSADPKNIRQLSGFGGIYEGRGDIHLLGREPAGASVDYAKACEVYDRARATDAGDSGGRQLSAECRTRLGRASLLLGRTASAGAAYQEALTLMESVLTQTSPDVDALHNLADAYAGLGDVEVARTASRGHGDEAKAHWQKAQAWYTSSVETWRKIPEPLHTRSQGTPGDGPQAVADKLRRCEEALEAQGSRPTGQPNLR